MSDYPEYEFTDPDGTVQRESTRNHLRTTGITHAALVKRGGRWLVVNLEQSAQEAKDKLWYAMRKGIRGLDVDDETAVVEAHPVGTE
jgi:hypothetical protein